MDTRPNVFKIKAGTHNLATMNSEGLFTTWALQTGQDLTTPWTDPDYTQSLLPRRSIERQTLALAVVRQGFYEADLVWPFMSSVMWSYFVTTIFSTAVYAAVTVQLPDESYSTKTWAFTAWKPRHGEGLRPLRGGYQVQLRLRAGTEVTT